MFTPYWRAWRAVPWRQPDPVPGVITMAAVSQVGTARGRGASPALASGGETAGCRRFAAWRQRQLAGYQDRHDDLAGDQTSRLSAYLRFGCVSPLEVAVGAHRRAPRAAGNRSARPPGRRGILPPAGLA